VWSLLGQDSISKWIPRAQRAITLVAGLTRAPEGSKDRVALFLPFVGISEPVELPDPYYGTNIDFQRALDLARDGIMAHVGRMAGI
jgi:protein-tyrosine-phosphatase